MKKLTLSLVLFLIFSVCGTAFTADGEAFFDSGLIFEPGSVDFKSCHGSTLTELPGGDIMAAWYGGDFERAKNVAIYASILEKGKNTWSKPWIIQNTPGKSEGNPVLWTGPDNQIWFFYVTIMKETWNEALIFLKKSNDRGKTWSEPVDITTKYSWMTRNKPLMLENGYILLPIYNETMFDSEFLVSRDNFKTWKMSSIIRSPGTNLQPTVVQLSDGSLLTGMRTGSKNGLMWWSKSKNNGKSWSKAFTNKVHNPHSACDMVKLPDGKLALVYNDSPDKRNPLTVAISVDEGVNWDIKKDLEKDDFGSYSYPAIISTSDGLIHVTYTYRRESIKYAVFNSKWVESK